MKFSTLFFLHLGSDYNCHLYSFYYAAFTMYTLSNHTRPDRKYMYHYLCHNRLQTERFSSATGSCPVIFEVRYILHRPK